VAGFAHPDKEIRFLSTPTRNVGATGRYR